ncbi:16S rRNA (cytosine(1402)-N(4))-methyltransferase RsmH [Fluviispira sanaruensis]|uniref:Ribosomal RNA small subunit methyltransferase H n=1 Tax=Fluviispira sanaruensis TaxID=2493639 RepID=A0A4P2VG24_FLUSA|nr:16S rRNA (cytosine(1402)-N(4))-methyltransferase RsmH [Fluviispira sanaruensis]BBH51656.1 16S rRNA (cytosine(1402)-N(4))-methyltransferase RsmH [Fluviispira sanaruensis]
MNQEFHHTTVLKSETIDQVFPSEILLQSLNCIETKNLIFVDCTLGGGGHSCQLVEIFAKKNLFTQYSLTLIAFDRDETAISYAKSILNIYKNKYPQFNFFIFNENFGETRSIIESHFPGKKIHGLIADFGVSSPQLDWAERGFSFLNEGPIDMRMDTHESLTALDILNNYSEKELTRIFFDYGEEPKARKLAKAIVEDRKIAKLQTANTIEFADYVKRVLAYPKGKAHPATRTFQALRIEVNNELASIEKLLQDLPKIIHPHGKAGFISFHSLEDRIVKHAMRNWQKGKNAKEKMDEKKELNIPLHLMLHLEENHSKGFGKEVPRGGTVASEEECLRNNRSRSARLRCFEFCLDKGS